MYKKQLQLLFPTTYITTKITLQRGHCPVKLALILAEINEN